MPYLDEFVKSLTSLHSDLRDKYGEIGRLDVQFQERQKQLQDLYEQELVDAKKGSEPGNAHVSQFSIQVSGLAEICKAIADQKIQMATEIYKKVDGHIRRLDKHLKKFDQESKSESKIVSLSISELMPEPYDKVWKEDNIGETGADDRKLTGRPETMELDLPVDPNEPTYCICNRVSFGEMVACDNDNCKIEWFHYECVGITDRPKGKWYCPECAPSMKQRKKG